MATIWDDKNHSSGEVFTLSKKPRTDVKSTFSKVKLPVTKISKKDYDSSKNKQEINLFKSGNEVEVYFKDTNTSYNLKIDDKSFSSFVWNNSKGKSNTEMLTKIKELISLWVILEPKKDEEYFIKKLKESNSKFSEFYETKFYESAKEQYRVLPKKYNLSSYYGERQNYDVSKVLYSKMKKLVSLHYDNWNPADIWFFKISKSQIQKDIKDFVEIAELNNYVINKINSKEIIPISLKQTTPGHGKFEYISSKNSADIKINLDITDIDLSDSFNNFIVNTKSKFQIRVGFKSSKNSLSVFFEGRMKGAGYQLGAVDKRVIKEYLNFKDNIRKVPSTSYVKSVLTSNIKIKNSNFSSINEYIEKFESFDDFQKQRAYNVLLVLDSFLESYKKKGYELMKLCYLSSRKMTDKASDYLILK